MSSAPKTGSPVSRVNWSTGILENQPTPGAFVNASAIPVCKVCMVGGGDGKRQQKLLDISGMWDDARCVAPSWTFRSQQQTQRHTTSWSQQHMHRYRSHARVQMVSTWWSRGGWTWELGVCVKKTGRWLGVQNSFCAEKKGDRRKKISAHRLSLCA